MLLDRDEKMTLRYSSQCGSPEALKYFFLLYTRAGPV